MAYRDAEDAKRARAEAVAVEEGGVDRETEVARQRIAELRRELANAAGDLAEAGYRPPPLRTALRYGAVGVVGCVLGAAVAALTDGFGWNLLLVLLPVSGIAAAGIAHGHVDRVRKRSLRALEARIEAIAERSDDGAAAPAARVEVAPGVDDEAVEVEAGEELRGQGRK